MSVSPPGGLPSYTNPNATAFGALTTAGYTPPTAPITGGATVLLWGRWAWRTPISAERSTDGGTTWEDCGDCLLEPPGSGVSSASFALDRDSRNQTGTAIYRLGLAVRAPAAGRLTTPLIGCVVNWAIYQ